MHGQTALKDDLGRASTMKMGDHKYIQHIFQKIRREETRLKIRWEERKMYLTGCGIDQTDTGNIP
jgi:hypothetical protein